MLGAELPHGRAGIAGHGDQVDQAQVLARRPGATPGKRVRPDDRAGLTVQPGAGSRPPGHAPYGAPSPCSA